MATDLDLRQVVKPRIFPDPAVITDLKTPWKFHTDTWLYPHPRSDLGTEQAQHGYPEAAAGQG
jgi:hypothetical protein